MIQRRKYICAFQLCFKENLLCPSCKTNRDFFLYILLSFIFNEREKDETEDCKILKRESALTSSRCHESPDKSRCWQRRGVDAYFLRDAWHPNQHEEVQWLQEHPAKEKVAGPQLWLEQFFWSHQHFRLFKINKIKTKGLQYLFHEKSVRIKQSRKSFHSFNYLSIY